VAFTLLCVCCGPDAGFYVAKEKPGLIERPSLASDAAAMRGTQNDMCL